MPFLVQNRHDGFIRVSNEANTAFHIRVQQANESLGWLGSNFDDLPV